LQDLGLAEYYDHLKLIMQGPLWDWQRFVTICKMNLGRYDHLLEPTRRSIRSMMPICQLQPDPDRPSDKDNYDRSTKYYAQMMEYYRQCLEDCTRTIRLYPNDVSAYKTRYMLYIHQGQRKEAIQDICRIIELEPDNVFAHEQRGILYTQQEQFDKAIQDFNRTIELKPQKARAYNARGVVYAKQGKYELAIQDSTRTIELDPQSLSAYVNRAQTYVKLHDWQHAMSDFHTIINLVPSDPTGYTLLTNMLYSAGGLIAPNDSSSEASGTISGVINGLAWILATHPDSQFRDGAEALRYIQEVLALESNVTPPMLDTLGVCYAETDHFEEAIAAVKRAIALATENGQHAMVQRLRGRLQLYEARKPYHLTPSKKGDQR
jgi:tetratricopeptide (TPR) repeat protein